MRTIVKLDKFNIVDPTLYNKYGNSPIRNNNNGNMDEYGNCCLRENISTQAPVVMNTKSPKKSEILPEINQ